jgi:hypothetical protein
MLTAQLERGQAAAAPLPDAHPTQQAPCGGALRRTSKTWGHGRRPSSPGMAAVPGISRTRGLGGQLPARAVAVVAPRPAAGPALSFLELLLGPPNAALAGRLLLGILDPADEFVAGQGRDVLPGIERGGVGGQRLTEVRGQSVYHPTGHSLAAHGPMVVSRAHRFTIGLWGRTFAGRCRREAPCSRGNASPRRAGRTPVAAAVVLCGAGHRDHNVGACRQPCRPASRQSWTLCPSAPSLASWRSAAGPGQPLGLSPRGSPRVTSWRSTGPHRR